MIRYIGSIRHVRRHATKTVPEHLKRNPKEIRISSTGFTKAQDVTAKVLLAGIFLSGSYWIFRWYDYEFRALYNTYELVKESSYSPTSIQKLNNHFSELSEDKKLKFLRSPVSQRRREPILFDIFFNASLRNELGLDYAKYLHIKDEKEMSLLMYSLQVLRTTQYVKQLIELGADTNESDMYDKSILGWFPKHNYYCLGCSLETGPKECVIEFGDKDLILFLMENSANVNKYILFPEDEDIKLDDVTGRKNYEGAQQRVRRGTFYFSSTMEKSAKLDNLGIENKPAI